MPPTLVRGPPLFAPPLFFLKKKTGVGIRGKLKRSQFSTLPENQGIQCMPEHHPNKPFHHPLFTHNLLGPTSPPLDSLTISSKLISPTTNPLHQLTHKFR